MDDLLTGFEDALLTQNVAYRYAFAKKADIASVFSLFDRELTKFPKRNGWWDPPKNLALNSSLMGINLWSFSLLPYHPLKRAYRAASDRFPDRFPEGIVIHPNWHPVNDKVYSDDDPEIAQKMVQMVKGFNSTLQSTVVEQMRWIETKFSIKIPDFIEAKLKLEVVKIATRRWGANRLKTKDTLIPFDGSKAIELGTFD
jgi:hypothetical protein